ncbi:hypothetical protein VNO80_10228 [Phaseolus coccineus]|uniref:Uncharacterized protein n=1 Tax=Phaseolus coccineus TaxID=3886 RepID=A0AAN9N7R2_PHACN
MILQEEELLSDRRKEIACFASVGRSPPFFLFSVRRSPFYVGRSPVGLYFFANASLLSENASLLSENAKVKTTWFK